MNKTREMHLATYGMLLYTELQTLAGTIDPDEYRRKEDILDIDTRLSWYEQLGLSWHEQMVVESAFTEVQRP
jgi:hypothetical protein